MTVPAVFTSESAKTSSAPVAAIVMFDPDGVIVIPEPATNVSAPVKLFREATPELPPKLGGQK